MRDRANRFARTLTACAFLLVLTSAAGAGNLHLQPGIFSDPEFDPVVSFDAGASHVSGSAHEYVFSKGGSYKLSQLDWQINNVVMANFGLGVRLTPWVGFKLDAGTKMMGQSEMDDYDWLQPGKDWTHFSNSPATTVSNALRVDLSSSLSLFRHPHFSVDALAGLRWNMWEFDARGGHYIYTSDNSHFRDLVGDFPSGVGGITFKQNMYTPYLGLALNVDLGRFGLDAAVLGSQWVFTDNYDQHHQRTDIAKTGALFHDVMHNGSYVDYKFGGSYKFNEQVKLSANWERETYALVRGSDTISAIGTGVNGTGGGTGPTLEGPVGGSGNTTDRLSVGVTYSLD